jgi:hypothetical protein
MYRPLSFHLLTDCFVTIYTSIPNRMQVLAAIQENKIKFMNTLPMLYCNTSEGKKTSSLSQYIQTARSFVSIACGAIIRPWIVRLPARPHVRENPCFECIGWLVCSTIDQCCQEPYLSSGIRVYTTTWHKDEVEELLKNRVCLDVVRWSERMWSERTTSSPMYKSVRAPLLHTVKYK